MNASATELPRCEQGCCMRARCWNYERITDAIAQVAQAVFGQLGACCQDGAPAPGTFCHATKAVTSELRGSSRKQSGGQQGSSRSDCRCCRASHAPLRQQSLRAPRCNRPFRYGRRSALFSDIVECRKIDADGPEAAGGLGVEARQCF
jgi:hypothetical protein